MSIREHLTRAQRCEDLGFTIDPGFVHRRKIETILGDPGIQIINEMIAKLPDLPTGLRDAQVDRIYKTVFLVLVDQWKVPSLHQLIAEGKGRLFCSVEKFGPCPAIWDNPPRVASDWIPTGDASLKVRFEYSTDKVRSDTLRSQLASGDDIAICGSIRNLSGDTLLVEPLIMGGPWIPDSDTATFDAMWFAQDFHENFVEDFDEFSKVADTPVPADSKVMADVTEAAFKQCLANIIGGDAPKDWGGETSDLYSSHLHLAGKRTSGAFLLKGPAKFKPMTLAHLGKNNDQIVRLAQEPAQVLIVQHCHEILSPVRATLRAFAVQPGRPRRYCLIDGRDSLRLLQAYDQLETALKLSKAS